MGNANIDDELRDRILQKLENAQYRAEFQNLKGFMDNACIKLLEQLDKNQNFEKEIIEGMQKQSGLNFANFINSVYLTPKREVIPKELPTSEQIDLRLKNLGLKDVKRNFSKDTYYGLLTTFAWHKGSSNNGAGFTPINYKIDRLIEQFPEDMLKLNAIKRRLNYIIFLEDEIKYICERYDFDRIPVMMDWLTNKFEELSRSVAELCLILIEYYYEKTSSGMKNDDIRFEELVRYIVDLDKLFKFINTTLEGFILVAVRHEIVHSTGYSLNKKGDEISVSLPEIYALKNRKGKKMIFGIMEDYVKDVYDLFYNGKNMHKSDIIVNDPRFQYVSLKYKVTKSGTIEWSETKLIFNLTLNQYLNMATGYIFLLSRTLLDKLITQPMTTTTMP